ncbi:MAG TPA: STAS domain-containing protein [Actinomycetota bacterium]|nr:STAS domain-containing protein [Actinomycetota bacterium]
MESLRIRRQGEVIVAQLSGEIDLTRSADLKDDLISALDDELMDLVLDLSEVRYMDSSGITVLFHLARRLETKRRGLGIFLPAGSPLQRLFKITHVHEAALLCESLEECIEALKQQR